MYKQTVVILFINLLLCMLETLLIFARFHSSGLSHFLSYLVMVLCLCRVPHALFPLYKNANFYRVFSSRHFLTKHIKASLHGGEVDEKAKKKRRMNKKKKRKRIISRFSSSLIFNKARGQNWQLKLYTQNSFRTAKMEMWLKN